MRIKLLKLSRQTRKRVIHNFADQPQRVLRVNAAFYVNIAEKLAVRTILSAHLTIPSRFFIAKRESQTHTYHQQFFSSLLEQFII